MASMTAERDPKPKRRKRKPHRWTVQKIQAFRKSRSWTNQTLADKLGVSVTTLAGWLYNAKPIPLTVAKLLDCLEMQAD